MGISRQFMIIKKLNTQLRSDKTTGVVLAGGKGHRIGGEKAFVQLAGKTLIQRVIDLLSEVFSEVVVVVVDNIDRFRGLPCRCLTDRLPGLGPIGGIETALRYTSREAVFVVACDMPFINPDVIRLMIDRSEGVDLVIPSLSDGLHPLHTFYARGCLPAIDAQIKAGDLGPHSLPQRVRSTLFQEESFLERDPLFRSVMNINTPADLESAHRILEGKQL